MLLLFQKKTMQMMYEIIYTALKEAGLHDTYQPQDYLNFFCLGNREAPDLANDDQNASINSPQVNFFSYADNLTFCEKLKYFWMIV